jgi:transcriptional regulator with XRE-family HTH domain
MNKLISKLEQYRLEHRITQQQLATKLGVSFPTVSRWLNGRAMPQPIQRYHILKLLGLSDAEKKK